MREYISASEWDERLRHEDVPKDYLNKLVMNYLVRAPRPSAITPCRRDTAAPF